MPPPKPPTVEINLPEFKPGLFRGVIILIIVVWGVWSSVYKVPAESVGVIQRFGKALDASVLPGLHFKAPFGVDRVSIVPVERQLKLEFGFSTEGYTNPDQAGSEPSLEYSMVTGDLNAAWVNWVVQYRIDNPRLFLFHVENPGRTLRDLSEGVMREVIGDRTVDEVITIGRQEIESVALEKMNALSKVYEIGVTINQVQLKDVDPPEPVQDSFNEVNKAQQDRETAVNDATREYNQVVPLAKGEADQKIRAAEGYKLKRINEAEGDVASFKAQLEEYVKAPDITRTRLYLEAMKEVLPAAGPKMIVDDSVKQIMPLLPGMGAVAPAAASQIQGGARR
ncbi:MAG: FtsH protease activity modulator HflK [Verrucomicrobiales bacterium]